MKENETLEEVAEIILANNIDGLRDALKDDDLFYFYKGVIQCYGEAMAKWQQEQDKNKYSEEDIINALHSVELKDNKDYSKIYNGMKQYFQQFKNK
jgi:hypothetical protein